VLMALTVLMPVPVLRAISVVADPLLLDPTPRPGHPSLRRLDLLRLPLACSIRSAWMGSRSSGRPMASPVAFEVVVPVSVWLVAVVPLIIYADSSQRVAWSAG